MEALAYESPELGIGQRAKRWRLVYLTALVVLAALVGTLAATSLPITAAVLGLFAFAVLLVLARKHLLLMLLVVTWYVPAQAVPNGLLGSFQYLRWISFALIPLILGAFLIEAVVKKRSLHVPRIALPMLIVALALAVSTLVNGSSPSNFLASLAIYLRYPLLFIAIANSSLQEEDFDRVVKLFLVLTFLQVPEVLGRYFFAGAKWDSISWSLGPWGTLPLGIYATYSACIIAGRAVSTRLKPFHVIAFIALLVPALPGEIKALLISLPISILLVFLYPWKGEKKLGSKTVPILVVLATAVVLLINWHAFWGGDDYLSSWVSGLGGISTDNPNSSSLQQMNRVGNTAKTIDILTAKNSLVFGSGPGSSWQGNLSGTESQMYSAVGTGQGHTQISAILWDAGLLGLAAYLLLLVYVLTLIFKNAKIRASHMDKSLTYGMLGIWFFYAILGPQYDLIWRIDASSFLFWVLAAKLYLNSNQQNNRRKLLNDGL